MLIFQETQDNSLSWTYIYAVRISDVINEVLRICNWETVKTLQESQAVVKW